ncbi:MAG: DUF481 domain-containing protein [Bacteroidetes bacterium]|nr:DUF481 domain-containing protein [Bacteroidota bacterium]
MRWLSLLIVLLSPVLVWSQEQKAGADTARHAADSVHHTDTVHYHYNYTGTGTVNSTNSLHSSILNNSLKLSMAKKSATVDLMNSWIYGKQNAVLTNNDYSGSLAFNLYKAIRHAYFWGMANYNTSIPLQINHQLQAGLGVGYNVSDKKMATLILSDGPLYERGDLYDSLYGGPNGNVFRRDRYQTVRNSFRVLGHFVIRDRYTLDGTFFLQNSFAYWRDYILRVNGSVAIKLYKWLALTASYSYSQFTRTRGRNTLLSFGLTIQK